MVSYAIANNFNVTDEHGRQIVLALTNSKQDGSGTWFFDGGGGNPFETRLAKAIDASIGAYGAKDIVNDTDCSVTATAWEFLNMAADVGGYGVIDFASLVNETENQAVRYELLLFDTSPTGALEDNTTNDNPLKADRSKYLGRISLPSTIANGATVASTTLASPSTVGNLPFFYKCAAASTSLFGVLITLDVYTQTATDDIEIALRGSYL